VSHSWEEDEPRLACPMQFNPPFVLRVTTHLEIPRKVRQFKSGRENEKGKIRGTEISVIIQLNYQ